MNKSLVSFKHIYCRINGFIRFLSIDFSRYQYSQPYLLHQIFIFFNCFWNIKLSWYRATIMPFKVCEIVSAQELIRAGEDADSWEIERSNPSISPILFAESNLPIFPVFLNRWTRLGRLYNLRRRKFFVRGRLCEVRGWWPTDREGDLASRRRPSGGRISLGLMTQRMMSGKRQGSSRATWTRRRDYRSTDPR